MKIVSQVEAYYPSLSKGEKRVANYILQHQQLVIYQPLHEIARESGVGEATVVRFCNKIGYSGFQMFKLDLAKESPRPDFDSGGEYVEAITSNLTKAIQDTKSLLDGGVLNQAIQLLEQANRIYIFGVGTSGTAALDMQSKLLRYGKIVTAITDPHFQKMASAVLEEKDLIIAFSLSGYTVDIVESVELAKENGAQVLAVTNHVLSPVATLADVVLLTAGRESPMDGGSLSGRVSQLYIVDIVCTGYAVLHEEKSRAMRTKTAEAVVNKSLEHVLARGGYGKSNSKRHQ